METIAQTIRAKAIVSMLDDMITLAGYDNLEMKEELWNCLHKIKAILNSDNTKPEPDQECIDMLLSKGKIHAIKVYRQKTGLGLKDSKHAIDALQYKGLMVKGRAIPKRNH